MKVRMMWIVAVTVPEGVEWELDSKTVSVTITQKDEET